MDMGLSEAYSLVYERVPASHVRLFNARGALLDDEVVHMADFLRP